MRSFESLFGGRWVPLWGIVRHLFKFGRLYGRLLRDPRVPFYLKLLFFIPFLYILSPIDLIPEAFLSVFGLVDDIGLLLFMLKLFLRLCPEDVVREHVEHIAKRV